MTLELLAGILLAIGFVVSAKRVGRQREMLVYAFGLFAAAVIYVGFALVADVRWLAIEAAGLLLYTGLAWLGLRSPWWLAVGWLAHAAWDTFLHLVPGTPTFVPDWYPGTCIAFDLLVAAVLARESWMRRALAPATNRAAGAAKGL